MRRMAAFVLLFVAALAAPGWASTPPTNFSDAKELARKLVWHDWNQGALGTAYCGCDWTWTGRSGGRIDLQSCGYRPRAQATRAARLEWEHVVPAHSFGQQRQCWQRGGREYCRANDPAFRAMEADLHNLVPAIGEVNADRSNFRLGMIPGEDRQYGACDFEVDFKARVAEPRDAVKGLFARVYFYMYDRYDLRMSDAQEQLLMAWDKQFPVTEWERERDRRIARIMGHSNPFVTGARQWSRGHRNTKEGLVTPIPANHPARGAERREEPASPHPAQRPSSAAAPIVGNRNSKVYHLPEGCPSYAAVSARNRVTFESEAQARAAGYRKAGNCR
ncbi:MAG: deoxyribonuclease I [Proteobacteria bacterium]|nr:MAG: deoxyribonuclease I [Pseudomonadota bacterium]